MRWYGFICTVIRSRQVLFVSLYARYSLVQFGRSRRSRSLADMLNFVFKKWVYILYVYEHRYMYISADRCICTLCHWSDEYRRRTAILFATKVMRDNASWPFSLYSFLGILSISLSTRYLFRSTFVVTGLHYFASATHSPSTPTMCVRILFLSWFFFFFLVLFSILFSPHFSRCCDSAFRFNIQCISVHYAHRRTYT